MNIGLYFGSFNPIHTGHLIIASHVLNETNIQKIWFVLSPQNPLKASLSLLNEYDRLFLLQKAIEEDDRMKASDIEFLLPKPSYTIDTLTYLTEKYPEHQFNVIMGSDSFENIGNWKNGDKIIANYPVFVYERPGFELKLPKTNITVLNAPFLQISSTHIRHLIENGKSFKYLVPDIVELEIIKSRFFKAHTK
jgi:nicotinate-nucleotide adenylyltransferase